MTARTTIEVDDHLRPYFFRDDYVMGRPQKGTLETNKSQRVLVLPEELIEGLHQSLEEQTGHAWPIVAHTCGRKWGERLMRLWRVEWGHFYGKKIEDVHWIHFEVWLTQAFKYYGWGELEVDFELEEEGIVQVYLKDSVLARLLEGVVDNDHVCEIFAGLLGAVFSSLTREELTALEVACSAGGHERCQFAVAREEYIEDGRQARLEGGSQEAILEAIRG